MPVRSCFCHLTQHRGQKVKVRHILVLLRWNSSLDGRSPTADNAAATLTDRYITKCFKLMKHSISELTRDAPVAHARRTWLRWRRRRPTLMWVQKLCCTTRVSYGPSWMLSRNNWDVCRHRLTKTPSSSTRYSRRYDIRRPIFFYYKPTERQFRPLV